MCTCSIKMASNIIFKLVMKILQAIKLNKINFYNIFVAVPKLEQPPAIDYEQLRRLCGIEGLKDVQ